MNSYGFSTINRRDLLLASVALAFPRVAVAWTGQMNGEGLVDFLRDLALHDPVREIGAEVLSSPSWHPHISAVLDELPTRTDRSELVEIISARVQADFRRERTILIDGWCLAETEALICAAALCFSLAENGREHPMLAAWENEMSGRRV